jgi:uncharacterized protein (TIGR02145 family)
MKKLPVNLLAFLFLIFGIAGCFIKDVEPEEPEPNPDEDEVETPFTEIPDEYVGTWYTVHNEGPLTTNWEQGTFQGEQGFREFRTLILTKDGKNAVEYTSEIMNVSDEVKQYMYQLSGTLTFNSNTRTLTFHPRKGKMRIFSNKYTSYKEFDVSRQDILSYSTVITNTEATTYTSSPNFLTGKRLDGEIALSARYVKVEADQPRGETPNGYDNPPATGTYVQIGNQYYPTIAIGDLEWMSVNYAGLGGIKISSNPEYGTFYKYMDLDQIEVPDGWRIPNKQDYMDLLASQEIEFDEIWESTDGDDLESKKKLGQLMSKSGWLKQDGFANNKSGFNAVPANLQVTEGTPHGEGSNCLLWTSEIDQEGHPVIFKIIQLPSDTFASFGPSVIGFNPAHIPLRLVKDK